VKIRKVSWLFEGKKGTAWRLDCRVDGQRIQKQFKTKVLAEIAYQKLIQGTDLTPARLPSITFKDFVDIYKQKKVWKTESYKDRVVSALGLFPEQDRALAGISIQRILEYRDARAAKSAASTVRQDIAALYDLFRYAVKLGYLRRNPVDGVEKPSLPVKQDDPGRYLTAEQFGDLLVHAGRDVKLYTFAVWSGLRITELLGLDWADVQDDYVVVRRGKGRKQRIVPLLPAAKEALKGMPRSMLRPAKVFGWAGDRHTVLRRFQRRCRWAGLPRFRFHDLRHSFGSWAAMAGVDLEVIAACMGHTSTVMTRQYAHLHPSYKRAEILKMDRSWGEVSRKAAKRKRVRHS
jgi:integrase